MEKYENTSITIKIEEKFIGPSQLSQSHLTEINKLGQDGWKLVTIVPLAMGMGRTISAIATFERKLK